MIKRAVRNSARAVRKLWHLTMRASRTGVINLSPSANGYRYHYRRRWGNSSGDGDGGGGGDKLPGRARRPRRGYSWYGRLGTLGRYSWRTIAVCTIRILCGPTTNSRTELPPARVSHVNKTSVVRMFVSTDAAILPMVADASGKRDWLTVTFIHELFQIRISILAENKCIFFLCKFKSEIKYYILSRNGQNSSWFE